jgi:hypothetical protein
MLPKCKMQRQRDYACRNHGHREPSQFRNLAQERDGEKLALQSPGRTDQGPTGLAPKHALAHAVLGSVLTATNRAVQGIAELERALMLDRNLAPAHAAIGWGKYIIGRSAETGLPGRKFPNSWRTITRPACRSHGSGKRPGYLSWPSGPRLVYGGLDVL